MRKKYWPLSGLESQSGTGKWQGLRPPDEAGAVLEHEGETEGQEQAVERVAAVERADQQALDDQAEDRGQDGRDDSAPQKPMKGISVKAR